jgi:hypothetical protein
LVDAHCHLSINAVEDGPFLGDEAGARRRLDDCGHAGVTVVRDVGGRREVMLALRLALIEGWPHVLAVRRFSAPAGLYFRACTGANS